MILSGAFAASSPRTAAAPPGLEGDAPFVCRAPLERVEQRRHENPSLGDYLARARADREVASGEFDRSSNKEERDFVLPVPET